MLKPNEVKNMVLEIEHALNNLEYNLNPIIVKVIIKDHDSILLGCCVKKLYGLRSELTGKMVFNKDFKDWRIDECNLQIFDGSKVIMNGNATMLMDFDAASKTDIVLNLNCSEERFVEQLTGYDFCNEFEGNWQLGMTFFNEFKDSKITSKLEFSKIKFISHFFWNKSILLLPAITFKIFTNN